MRGKELRCEIGMTQEGITPAYAGKRNACNFVIISQQDHPRLCGEKFFLAPLVLSVIRITPAYAGKRLA